MNKCVISTIAKGKNEFFSWIELVTWRRDSEPILQQYHKRIVSHMLFKADSQKLILFQTGDIFYYFISKLDLLWACYSYFRDESQRHVSDSWPMMLAWSRWQYTVSMSQSEVIHWSIDFCWCGWILRSLCVVQQTNQPGWITLESRSNGQWSARARSSALFTDWGSVAWDHYP